MAIDYNLGRIAEQEDYDIVFSDHLPIEAYASAFRAAGFHDFAVHVPDLEPPAETADEGDYWDCWSWTASGTDAGRQPVRGVRPLSGTRGLASYPCAPACCGIPMTSRW